MGHSDDAYAAMLLTMALSPNREEYARPLGVQEYRRLEATVRESGYRDISALLDMDISGLMMNLGLSQEEAYRTYTLLHREVQLTYALEEFMARGIDVITQFDDEYPRRLNDKLKESAPPFLYRCGNMELLDRPAIAVMGISGVRTSPEARGQLEVLVREATRLGYNMITGGELGVARLTGTLVQRLGGRMADVLGGGMREHLASGPMAELVGENRGAVISMEHPDAMFTVNHAIARNRLVFALADVAFIFNTDGRRGESEALQNRACDWIYAWEGYPGNRPLLAKRALPFRDLNEVDFDELNRHWKGSQARQINMFDLF